jgi:hypothetical protein
MTQDRHAGVPIAAEFPNAHSPNLEGGPKDWNVLLTTVSPMTSSPSAGAGLRIARW